MGEIYEDSTELEEFETRLDKRMTKMEERLDDVEWSIYAAQEDTLEKLNTPFTKWEGLILFIGWVWWNFFVSGIMDKNWVFNLFSCIGIILMLFTGFVWIYLLKKR